MATERNEQEKERQGRKMEARGQTKTRTRDKEEEITHKCMSQEDTARGHKIKSRKPKYFPLSFLQTLRKQLFHSMGTGKFFS